VPITLSQCRALTAALLLCLLPALTPAATLFDNGLARVLDPDAYTNAFVPRWPLLPGDRVMIDDQYVDLELGYTNLQPGDSIGSRATNPAGTVQLHTVSWDGRCWSTRFFPTCDEGIGWNFGTRVFMGVLGTWTVDTLNNGNVERTATFQLVPYTLARAGGDGQSIAPSSSTPVPLAVRITYPDGNPAGGKAVVFSITANPNKGKKPSGGLRTEGSSGPSTAPTLTVVSDDAGRAAAVLDVGPGGGSYAVQATSVVAPGTVVPFSVSVAGSNTLDDVALSPKNLGDPADERSGCVGAPPAGAVQASTPNPIHIGTGNKFRVEGDYVGPGPFPLAFARHYNSYNTAPAGSLGAHWRGSYDRSVTLTTVLAAKGKQVATTVAQVARPSGQVLSFTLGAGNAWVAEPDVSSTLQSLAGGGFAFTCGTDVVETFDGAGKLLSVAGRGGNWVHTLAYDTQGRLASVADSFGRVLRFSWDATVPARLAGFIDPAGRPYAYAYDALGNLASVRYVDGAVRGYVYENAQWPAALTGIVDERGVRYASFGYDALGRAVSSSLANGAGAVQVSYFTDGSRGVADGRGAVRRYGFAVVQGVPRRTSLSSGACDSCGSASTFTTWDAAGRVSAVTDYKGMQTTYVRDARGLETSRTEAVGTPQAHTIITSWHPTFRLPLFISEPGRSTAFEYDGGGRLLTRTLTDTASGAVQRWRYAYTAAGLLARIDGPRSDVNDVTTLSYDAAGNLVSVVDGPGRITSYSGYDADGHPSTIVDPNGLVTSLSYDARGRLLSRSAGGLGTAWSYDAAGLLVRVANTDGSAQSFAYDGAQRLVAVADQLGNVVELTRDANGNVLRQETKAGGGGTVALRQFTYDAMDQRVDDVDSQGHVDLRRSYDANGNVVATVDPFGASTRYVYDALNRPTSITDALGGVITLGHDALDQLRSVVDPKGVATSYVVDGLGRRLQETSADAGTSTRSFNEAGQVAQRTWANGRRATYAYDALGRLLSADDGAGGVVRYGYDELNASNFGVGRLTSMADASGNTRWRYDALGRLVQTVQTVGSLTQAVTRSYNAAGQLQQLTYPSGRQVSFAYSQGQLRSIAVDGTPQLTDITWQPFGGVRLWSQGGAWRQRSFDLDGRLASYSVNGDPRILAYDEKNRIVGSGPRIYAYDAVDRLVRDTTLTYAYDANGNRTSKSGPAGISTYNTAAGTNRLTSVSGAQPRSYTYDAAGNVIGDGQHALNYDGFNRLAGVDGMVSYLLNGINQRVGKLAQGVLTTYVYDDEGHLLGEYDASGAPLQETVYLGDTPVMVLKPSGVFFIDADQIDTPRAIRDGSNNVVWTWDADAFGEALPDEDPRRVGVPFNYNLRMPGQVFDRETGWFYNWNRHYDPSGGRYQQFDAVGLAADPNPFTYADNEPLGSADPFGLANRKYVNLGQGYTGNIDTFDVGGKASFEIHVLDKGGKEVGIFGPEGWFNKHGLTGRPDGIPASVENQCKGQAIDIGRRMRVVPPKGAADISGSKWKRFFRALPMLGPMIEATRPSVERACEVDPSFEGC
jgi:RHS repeat-associated protein